MVFECAVQVPASRIENSIRLTHHWGAFSVKPDHNGSNSLFFSLLQSNLRGKLVGSVGEQIGALSCTHTNVNFHHTHTHTHRCTQNTHNTHPRINANTHIPQTVTKMIHAHTARHSLDGCSAAASDELRAHQGG